MMRYSFNPKKGSNVSVCYDGKRGRHCEGIVLQTKKHETWPHNEILVEFVPWSSDDGAKVQCWFGRKNEYSFGGWVKIENSLMQLMFDAPGDWYSVYPMPKEEVNHED